MEVVSTVGVGVCTAIEVSVCAAVDLAIDLAIDLAFLPPIILESLFTFERFSFWSG